MTRRRQAGLRRTAGLLALTLTGVVVASGVTATAQAATLHHDQPVATSAGQGGDIHTNDSKRFTVTNLTGYPLQLNAVSGTWEGTPAEGTWLLPGEQQHFELKYHFMEDSTGLVRYYGRDDRGLSTNSYHLTFKLNSVKSASSECRSAALGLGSSGGVCGGGGTNVTLLDKSGTVVNLHGDQAQMQAAALNRLCRSLSELKCTFDATNETKEMTPMHAVGLVYANRTLDPMTRRITISETVTRTQSVEVSTTVEAKVLKVVNMSIGATYGHSLAETKTFEESSEATVRPGYKVWSEMMEPIIRDTGNFKLTVGNTTFNLIGVHFDTPDPQPGPGRQPRLDTHTAPLHESDWNLPPISDMPSKVVSHRAA
jgi:cell division protein ZapA (FtsZ GTPase activity inhibitor)